MTTPTMNAPPDGRRTAEHTGSGTNPFANSRWARRQIRIVSPVHASTLAAIALDSNKDGVAVCGQERIAAATRYSVRAVRMALAWLEAQGYLRREERRRANGSRTSDRIILNLDHEDSRQEVPVVVDAATGSSRTTKRNLTAGSPAPDSAPTSFEEPEEEPEEESSEPIGSGPGKPAPDRKLVFSEGRLSLVTLGLDRRTAGDVIGKWLRETDDPGRVLAAIRSAHEHGATSPIPWINAHLQPRQNHVRTAGKSDLDQALDDAAEWLRALEQPHAGDPGYGERQLA